MRNRIAIIDIATRKFKALSYKQYDANNLLQMVILENGKIVDISSYNVIIYFKMPSGKMYRELGDIKNNTIDIILSSSVLYESGKVTLEVELRETDKIVTTFSIYLNVEKSIDGNDTTDIEETKLEDIRHFHYNKDVLDIITQEMIDKWNNNNNNKNNLSDFNNDVGFVNEKYVIDKIEEAQLQQGEIDLNRYQTKEDTTLETTNKTIVGAINEVNNNVMSKVNKSEIPTKTSQLTNDSNFLTSVPSEYVTESELNAKGYLTSVPSEYVTESELNDEGYLTEHQDISNKADKSEIPTKTSQLENDNNFISSIPSEYITEAKLNAKGYLTEHQDISNKADKNEVPTKTSQLTNDSGYLTEHQDISGKADKSEIPTKTSQLTNDSNFATQPNFTFEINMIASTEQPNVVTNGTYPNLVITFNIPQGISSNESGKPIYYGRLSISEVGGSVVQYNSITDAMIKNGTNITKITSQTLDRTSVGKQSETSKGDYIIVAVPNNEGYIVKKDNGLGGKIMFDKDVAGVNGIILNIDENEYAIYGEILISPAEIFIYVDKD